MKSCFYLKWWIKCLGRNHDLIPYTPYLIFLPIGGAIILRGGRFKSLLDDSWYDRYLIGQTYLAPCSPIYVDVSSEGGSSCFLLQNSWLHTFRMELKLYIFQENFLVYLPLVVKPLISNLVSAIARNLRKFPSAALSKTVISKGGSLSALRGFTANTALFVNQLSLLMKNSCRVWFFICSCQHFFCSRAPGVELEVASHEALKDLQLNTYQLCRKFLVQGHDISTTVNTSKLPTVHVLNRYNPTRMIHRTTKRKNEREKSEITFNYRTRRRLF